MTHRKDLLKKGYRSWYKKGTQKEMQDLGKKLKDANKIVSYNVAQCVKGMNKNKYELYVK